MKKTTTILWAVILVMVLLRLPAYPANINEALFHTFGNEGVFQKDPHDKGNYRPDGSLVGTKYGICARDYPKEDIPALTRDRAAFIYKNDFWGMSRCDQWNSQIIANLYFDVAVNIGQGTAARIIQRAVNYAGWPRLPIPVDGKIGPTTVKRLNEVDQVALFVHFVGLTHNRYVELVDANPKNMRYLQEWTAHRMRKNVQRSVHEYEAKRLR